MSSFSQGTSHLGGRTKFFFNSCRILKDEDEDEDEDVDEDGDEDEDEDIGSDLVT